ncbi:MAG TPA: GNAT family N-acetyltransferase [Candidatus Saccharimonadales bacterium]|nr:GNAT family N-acetyltransferase [Candidatus Saccharimonadales bacterium]
MNISVTRLTNQVEKMVELNRLFADVFEDNVYKDPSKMPSHDYLQSWLRNPDNVALVAQEGDNVVGGIVAYTLHKFEQERSEIYIYDLAVSRNQQRRGVGRQLVAEVCKIAKRQDSWTVFVQADEGDEAIKFYESLNPTENLKTRNFDLPLN